MTTVHEDLLDEALMDEVEAYFNNASWKYGWLSSTRAGERINSHWHHALTEPDSVQNGLDIATKLPPLFKSVWEEVSRELFPDHALLRMYANAHTYGTEGYPHRDTVRSGLSTLVIYLNRRWDASWGGETVAFLPEEGLASSPVKFNYGFLLDSKMRHVARGVSRECPELRKTLVIKAAPARLDLKRDKLQRFLFRKKVYALPHNRGNLFDHLLRTYDFLKEADAPEHLCLAGGAHSLFGTQVYKNAALRAHEEGELIKIIGPRAAELVKIFAKIFRAKDLEAPLAEKGFDGVDPVTRALCILDGANLLEQQSLGRFPHLQKAWEAYNQRERTP
tara:strand:+ start:3738 stop:4739 length:1002 start_codon:yes stop_codon:yes gene_type:complete